MEYSNLIESIDEYLFRSFISTDEVQKKVYESMRYSLSSGGKRVRPILNILTYMAVKETDEYSEILPFASAIEMIHTYSLIHDDLPAMDDDDIRRGKPTNHKVFNEATAILAGDGLLNMSMEVLIKEAENFKSETQLKRILRAIKYIYNASGVHGMVGGQVIDMEYSDEMNLDICETMYKLKTAALIRASVVSAAIVAGASDEEILVFEEFANCIGLAYQIRDDVLDVKEDDEIDKNTILRFLSVEELEGRIKDLTAKAVSELDSLKYDTEMLKNFAIYLINRSR